MGRQSWSIQLHYSDNSYSFLPIALPKLARFVSARRQAEERTIRKIKPIDMWLLEYAIHTARMSCDGRHICKVIVETGGE